MRTKRALFTGRFQPPSIAHAATVETILQQWSSILIGIATPSDSKDYDPKWQPYVEASSDRFTDAKAIFTPEEVRQMWTAWIATNKLGARAEFTLVPRIYLRAFAQQFPAASFDFVYPTPHESDSEGDRRKNELFPVLLGLDIFLVEPPFRRRNTEIRKLVAAGSRTWKECIPSGAYEVFMDLDGPKRMIG